VRVYCSFKKFPFQKKSNEFYSVVADFQLVCDQKDKVRWIQVLMAIGSVQIFSGPIILLIFQLVGSVFGGHMGDFFGRKAMFFGAQLLIIITSIMCTAAQGWIAFAVIQAVNNFLYGIIEVGIDLGNCSCGTTLGSY
jgi:MFS family permease